ncbi:MAG TPA: bifunctional DNA-binding transcriptional regulator/O6-methylguanine-DNA methyltransferase Ada [Acidimicrobiales bacterium]|nr:bifunctional DNA-binding transcriptional regulator/O6-methylguanine-DNA methyltransferase Ada [Acidimicrobiales bacterium]
MSELDDVRWKAVEVRDASLAGSFVYAVRTTGVYCRPGCRSRRPLRRNVEYFATSAEAQSAGYRSCTRCRPDANIDLEPMTNAVIAACREIEAAHGDVDVADVASRVGFSEGHLRRSFRRVTGVSLATYARECRAMHAREALRTSTSVTDAVFSAGYRSMSTFYEGAAVQLGMTPTRYRDGGRGALIYYTTLTTPVGVVLAARSQQGVCSVRVGDDEERLEKELADEFLHATIERDDEGLVEVAIALARAVRGEDVSLDLPLDVAGTAFQLRVWEALRRIPSGETRTYSQVAAEIGAPRAVRAVGSACGANHVALIIPCHRVIRQDGSLGGYRWGVGVKAALLGAEQAHTV